MTFDMIKLHKTEMSHKNMMEMKQEIAANSRSHPKTQAQKRTSPNTLPEEHKNTRDCAIQQKATIFRPLKQIQLQLSAKLFGFSH